MILSLTKDQLFRHNTIGNKRHEIPKDSHGQSISKTWLSNWEWPEL